VDLISDALPFVGCGTSSRTQSTTPSATQSFSAAHDAVIRVYDEAGNVIEAHEHAGRFQRVVSISSKTKSRHAVRRDG
jgi:hypothetical protein